MPTTNQLSKTATINAGGFININPGNGIWGIESDKAISIYSGYSSANAGFAPVEFGESVITATEFDIILPTNWNRITIDAPLRPNSTTNSDQDTLTDWEEIDSDFKYLKYNSNGITELPTLGQVSEMLSSDFDYGVATTVDIMRFDFNVFDVMNDVKILPIHSNPDDEDTDGDGFLDGEEYEMINSSIIMYSNPLVNEGNKGDYGFVIHNGKEYYIDVPNKPKYREGYGNSSYTERIWETVDTDNKSLSEFDGWRFIKGFAAPDVASSTVKYVGYNKRGNPKTYIKSPSGKLSLDLFLSGALDSAANAHNDHYININFMESGTLRKVIISAGSTSIYNKFQMYANDIPFSGYMENYGNTLYQYAIELHAIEMYEKITGEDVPRFRDEIYDYQLTIDKKHRDSIYSSYLWLNSKGELMEEIIMYPNDKLVLGTRSILYLNFNFDPLYEITMSPSSKAGEQFQKLIEPLLVS